MFNQIIVKQKIDILILCLLLLTLPLFFYKLGQSSLTSFDEAWYASIAQNIVRSGDFLNLTWNGNAYLDHPPVGFWLMALSFKIFGISEFSARFPSATLGFLSLIAVYFLGREMFNKAVGFASSLALASSFWFLYRARSGNLDVILTFFFILTFFLALKASNNKNYLSFFALSLSALLLSKTIVPFTIFPSLLICFYKTKLRLKDFLLPALILISLIGGWFLYQITKTPNFLNLYLHIGLPGVKTNTNYLENLKLIKEYLHSGIGKWFWPSLIGIFGGLIFRQKKFLLLTFFCVTFFAPFIFSEKGHIWHLIPLYPFLILSFFGFAFEVINKFTKKKIAIFIILFLGVYYSFVQLKISWYQFIDIPAFVSDEAILSKEAGKYSEDFYIDSDFVPTAAFYWQSQELVHSKKQVHQVSSPLKDIFLNSNFVMITYQWRLDESKIEPNEYRILKSDRDKILIRRVDN